MNSKLLTTVFVLMAVGGVSFAMPDADAIGKDDQTNHEDEIKKYLTMMEKMDIDQILNNTRLMTNYVKCFLNEGPCSAQLKDMKKMVPMLVKDSCMSCTKEQKKLVKKSMDVIKAQRPDDYEKLSKFFDPENKYEKKFLGNLKET